jgi:hypothetical protein
MRVSRRQFGALSVGAALHPHSLIALPTEAAVPLQPLAEQALRVAAALQAIGASLTPRDLKALQEARNSSEKPGIAAIESIFDPRVLMAVTINPEVRLSVSRGPASANLVQNGWTTFLIKVINEAGATPSLTIRSPQGGKMGRTSSLAITGVHDFTNGAVDAAEARHRWIALAMYDLQPMTAKLSGLGVEYRILQIYSRDVGAREASLIADCGFAEEDLGFRSTLPVLFHCSPAHVLTLRLADEHGAPCMASLLVRDSLRRVYPAQGKRALPDLSFQPQVYRADGEALLLGAAEYQILISRGPEYLSQSHSVNLDQSATLIAQLKRWIEPAHYGYYSGDTHNHAAGCSHYESPTEGVTPEVMERQALGEALDLGSVLNWGPGFNYQKQFFSGHTRVAALPHEKEAQQTLLRYDVEVSGFPSSHCGHLVLLRLKQDEFPAAPTIDDWPSWNLPILRWAKAQGAITGYAHSGHGLVTKNTALPNFEIPPFDSSGANEFLVDVTHPGMVDFLSGCDLWPFAELNLWYHSLNCGYRTAFAGETDFPCLTDECVGGGRTYARLNARPIGDDGYSAWLESFITGHGYAGDGRSHIFNFKITSDKTQRSPTFSVSDRLTITADVAAYLAPEQDEHSRTIALASPFAKPYWHIEKCRLGVTRSVNVELIVNGRVAGEQEIVADGILRAVSFDYQPQISSWYALRIYPSVHTQPMFIELGGRPVRASRASALWCRRSIDALWVQKQQRIRAAEMNAAISAYDHARHAYETVARESVGD